MLTFNCKSARTGLDASLQMLLGEIFRALDVVHDAILEPCEVDDFLAYTRKIEVAAESQVCMCLHLRVFTSS